MLAETRLDEPLGATGGQLHGEGRDHDHGEHDTERGEDTEGTQPAEPVDAARVGETHDDTDPGERDAQTDTTLSHPPPDVDSQPSSLPGFDVADGVPVP